MMKRWYIVNVHKVRKPPEALDWDDMVDPNYLQLPKFGYHAEFGRYNRSYGMCVLSSPQQKIAPPVTQPLKVTRGYRKWHGSI